MHPAMVVPYNWNIMHYLCSRQELLKWHCPCPPVPRLSFACQITIMRSADVVRSAALPARRDMQLCRRSREAAESQKFLQGRPHHGCQRRRSVLPAHPGVELSLDIIADRDRGSSHFAPNFSTNFTIRCT